MQYMLVLIDTARGVSRRLNRRRRLENSQGSAAAAQKFHFFFCSRRRRLENCKRSSAAAGKLKIFFENNKYLFFISISDN
jgi:hypothetical protein